MFEIINNGKKYVPKAALKVSCADYLVLAIDEDNNFIFVHSKDIFELRENPQILKDLAIPVNKSEIYNIRQSEIDKKDLIDFKNIKLSALNFKELLSIYKKFEFKSDVSSNIFKNRILGTLKKNLYNCKYNGKVDYEDDIKSLIKNIYDFKVDNFMDYELKVVSKEYINFLKVKVYEKMNIYELLKEHSRFIDVIEGKKDIDKLGFPSVDLFTLREVIEPAVRVLIYFKEDIILTELLNITRHALEINPFTVKSEEVKELNLSFKFDEDAKFNYNYLFYESLGINTDFVYEELASLNKWEFEEVSKHLFKVSEDVLYQYKDREEFWNILKETLIIYEDVSFVKYFINYLLTTLETN
ncbi:hypothetical protein [Anaerosphaera multitolerans]|uniref:Uncharacterized protein n=1 Tax=Anaerosphaera multitolerans TaxID=2487351 RepID=A0A437S4R3_9FIRM|nr:hypothetical protein [Anaerosphaera multitolerans]RVU53984.1 hypothetical protein EF514_09720 [Anaerosphaera multitolerans]